MKKFALLLAASMTLVAAVSCKKDEPTEEKHDVLVAPTGVNAPEAEIGSFSFVLTWNAVGSNDIASYQVSYKEETASTWSEITSYGLKAEITGLEMKHTYEARVRAISTAGEAYNSPWSQTVKVTTIQLIDVKVPTGLKSTEATSTSISLEWDVVDNAKGYIVSCKAEGGEPVLTEAAENKAVVEGLTPSVKYSVSVKTCSKSGEDFDSDYCSPITVETLSKSYGITSAGDFKEFLEILKTDRSGGAFKAADGIVHLRADVDLGEITAIDTTVVFSGVFDGENHKISNLNIKGDNYVGLFPQVVSAEVRNLTIDETCSFTVNAAGQIIATSAGSLAGVVCGNTTIENIINKGSVTGGAYSGGIVGSFISKDGVLKCTGCENYGSVTIPADQDIKVNSFVGGIIAASEGAATEKFNGEYKNCKNHGHIGDYSNNTSNLYHLVGGIAALGSDCYFENCSNDGQVTMQVTAASTHWLAGICARSYRSSYKDCSNSGKFDYTPAVSRNRELYVGGIIGYSGGVPKTVQTISGCTNTSDIKGIGDNQMTAKPIYVAGIVGQCLTTGIVITNCTNSGAISAVVTAANSSVAGIVGWANCPTAEATLGSETAKIANCVNTGDVTYETEGTSWIQCAGIVAQNKTAFLTVENCRNEGNISVDRTTRANVGGIICESNGSVLNCTNTGNIFVGNKHNDYYSNAAGIVARMVAKNQVVSGCINSGSVTYCGQGLSKTNLSEGYVGQGGIVSFLRYGDIKDCENTGLILGGESETYAPAYGSIAAWVGVGAASKVENCRVGGSVGVTDITAADYGASKATVLTADNYTNYIVGKCGSKYTSTIEGCTFKSK